MEVIRILTEAADHSSHGDLEAMSTSQVFKKENAKKICWTLDQSFEDPCSQGSRVRGRFVRAWP